MADFNFSESTITLDEWNNLSDSDRRARLVSTILIVASDSRIESLPGELDRFERVVVTSSDFNDGRFFSIGRQLRLLEFDGHLTLIGDILPDQYLALIGCGFDDVLSIDPDSIDKIINLDHTCGLASLHREITRKNAPVLSSGNKI